MTDMQKKNGRVVSFPSHATGAVHETTVTVLGYGLMFAGQSHLSSNLRLAVRYRPIDELTPDAANPRAHKPSQIKQLAKSMKTFGIVNPILIDAQSRIVAGHARVLAAKSLGLNEVPTILLEHLTPAQLRAFMVADNRLSELATWDERRLGTVLLELSVLDLDFDLEVTGFDTGEIDLRIEGLETIAEPDPADVLPEPVSGSPATQPGDVWQLGRHRIMCASALNTGSYETLLGDERAQMVFADPPYNVPIPRHASGLGAVRHPDFAMAVGEMTPEAYTSFLVASLGLAAGYSRPGALHFVCMDWRHLHEMQTAGSQVYTEQKNLCIWVKENAGMGSFYRSQHELVFVYKHGEGPYRNNIALGRFGRNRSNVWRYTGSNCLGRTTGEGNLLAMHPTTKPVALIADAIIDVTTRNGLVLDPFLGSGSSIIAAERTGRRCYGLELEPIYVDTAIRRWQAHTGGVARHAKSGGSFAEIAAEWQTCLLAGDPIHG
jgi:DNA methylase/ParB-like nuclease domain